MKKASAGDTRQKIINAAYKLFYRRGYGRVGVDEIAQEAGITKRTLYYHFDSKDQLLAAMLENQHELAMARVRKDGPEEAPNAEGVLSSRFMNLGRWVASRGWTGSGFTRLAMELADLPGHPARRMARRHKAEVEQWLQSQLKRAGSAAPVEHARECSILLEGAMVMILISGDRSYAELAGEMARKLTASGP